jgi:hypothetical protein
MLNSRNLNNRFAFRTEMTADGICIDPVVTMFLLHSTIGRMMLKFVFVKLFTFGSWLSSIDNHLLDNASLFT